MILAGLWEYQKWMKTRPRLKALDIYEIGFDTIKGSPISICIDIHQQVVETDEHYEQSTSPSLHICCSCTHLIFYIHEPWVKLHAREKLFKKIRYGGVVNN